MDCLGLAIATGLLSTAPRIDTLAFLSILEWRFILPIAFGDTISVISRVERSNSGQRPSRHRDLASPDQESRGASCPGRQNPVPGERPHTTPDLETLCPNDPEVTHTSAPIPPHLSYPFKPVSINALLTHHESFLTAPVNHVFSPGMLRQHVELLLLRMLTGRLKWIQRLAVTIPLVAAILLNVLGSTDVHRALTSVVTAFIFLGMFGSQLATRATRHLRNTAAALTGIKA